MPTYNAAAYMAKTSHELDELSNQLAFEINERLNELTTDEMVAFMENLVSIARNKNATQQLIAGTYAQNNAGQPALQLGAGSTTDPGAALMTVTLTADEKRLLDGMRNPTSGQQHAMRRLFQNGDAQHIPVEDDGTPSEVATLREKVTTLTKQCDKALEDLAEERNESQDGSLAKQLKDAKSKTTPPAPADMVEKAKVKSATDAVKDAVGKLSSPMMSKTIEGKSALDKAVDELDKLAK